MVKKNGIDADSRVEKQESPPAEVVIKISPDGLEATACIKPPPKLEAEQGDSDPTALEVKEQPITAQDIERSIRNFGINTGLDFGAIATLAVESRGETRVVARGIPPTPGKDGYVELKFRERTSYELPDESSRKVDWRGLVRIPTVKIGTELAVKRPPQPGKPGTSVTGEMIPPPPVKEAKLLVGKGCEIVDNIKIVATINGLPTDSRGRVSVSPTLVRNEGVNLKTGNVLFDGTVIVNKDVEENMVIQAGVDIEVNGNVRRAKLEAGGRVVVRNNLVGGSVRAGGTALLHLKCRDKWELLAKGLGDCSKVLHNLAKDPSFAPVVASRGWIPIFHQLLKTKFEYLDEVLAGIEENYRGVMAEQVHDVFAIVDPLKKLLTAETGSDFSIDLLSDLAELARQLLGGLGKIQEGESSVTAHYIQGTHVEAYGDIVVIGRGCYRANLWAGRSVKVKGLAGIVRGGTTRARDFIKVTTAGSKAGAPTFFKVDPRGVIEIDTAHPNVHIQVGNEAYKFGVTTKFITARINNQGELVIH